MNQTYLFVYPVSAIILSLLQQFMLGKKTEQEI